MKINISDSSFFYDNHQNILHLTLGPKWGGLQGQPAKLYLSHYVTFSVYQVNTINLKRWD